MCRHADSEDSDQTGRTGHFVGFAMSWLNYDIRLPGRDSLKTVR